jgi:7,8-dihydro-6-hydroxymethylpterin-pyrophosphokinase
LDLVFYRGSAIKLGSESDGEEKWLEIPHPRLIEREFVLRPLAE